jgi:hypothetical protein
MVDYDYRDQLSDEEKDWLDKFTDEYYCNGHTKKDSLHEESHKKELFDKTNAENRDLFGVSSCSGLITEMSEDEVDQLEESKESVQYRLKVNEQRQIMQELIDECIADLELSSSVEQQRVILKKLISESQSLVKKARKLIKKEKRNNKNK